MTVTFSSNRSAAIRAGLIAHARPDVVRRRRWRGIVLVLAGALVGSGATAAAFLIGRLAAGRVLHPIAQLTDTAEHVRAAWSYINHKDNAGKYDQDEVETIKGRIKRAAKKFDVEIESEK